MALPRKDGGGRLTILSDGQTDPVFSTVGYGAGTSFNEVDPATVVLVFDHEDPPATAFRMQRLRLEAGKSYTIVLSGASAGALKPITVTDAIRTYAVQ